MLANRAVAPWRRYLAVAALVPVWLPSPAHLSAQPDASVQLVRNAQLRPAAPTQPLLVPPLDEPLVPIDVPEALRLLVQSNFCNVEMTAHTTWHLSIINGGSPRGDQPARIEPAGFVKTLQRSWPSPALDHGQWLFALPSPTHATSHFGLADAVPVTGDFDGDGHTDVGVFSAGRWFVDLNGNGRWDGDDLWARLGDAGDQPVTGDWDGDGKTDIAVFGRSWSGDARALPAEAGLPDADNRLNEGRRKNAPPVAHAVLGWRTLQRTAVGPTRADAIDHVFEFGSAGDLVVSGDWNGDGIDNLGVFRHGHWVLDVDGDGKFTERDATFDFGGREALPIAGDFNGDGRDEVGVFDAAPGVSIRTATVGSMLAT